MRSKSQAKEEVVAEEMALMKRSQPSVEIKKDAKGQLSFTVKVYDDDPMEAATKGMEVMKTLTEKMGE